MTIKRYCFSCDLKDDPALIEEYKKWHMAGNIWPEITKSIRDAGIIDMQIFLTGNRMFMIMDVNETYSHERKAKMDAENPKVGEWERKMWTFQQELPWAAKGEKWMLMENIFQLAG